jgi:hypothetical protein
VDSASQRKPPTSRMPLGWLPPSGSCTTKSPPVFDCGSGSVVDWLKRSAPGDCRCVLSGSKASGVETGRFFYPLRERRPILRFSGKTVKMAHSWEHRRPSIDAGDAFADPARPRIPQTSPNRVTARTPIKTFALSRI